MRIGGIDPKSLSTEIVLVLPRGEEQNLVFRAIGLPTMDAFNARCPAPKPPGKMTKDGYVPQENDPTYVQVLNEWAKKRLGYMVLHSLAPSNIEWDTVSMDDPRSWPNWEKDLKNADLNEVEVGRVLGLVMEANALDEKRLQKAREVFLHGLALEQKDTSGQSSEQANSQSGEPAVV